jgi:hypothetical protein
MWCLPFPRLRASSLLWLPYPPLYELFASVVVAMAVPSRRSTCVAIPVVNSLYQVCVLADGADELVWGRPSSLLLSPA